MGIVNVTPDSFSDGGLRNVDDAVKHAHPDGRRRRRSRWTSAASPRARARSGRRRGGDPPRRAGDPPDRARAARRAHLGRHAQARGGARGARRGCVHRERRLGRRGPRDVRRRRAIGRRHGPDAHAGRAEDDAGRPVYDDVVAEVRGFLGDRVEAAVGAGIDLERLCVDPGIGFGKTLEHNLALLHDIRAFRHLGVPVLVGPSRKRFIGTLTGTEVGDRIEGTAGVGGVVRRGGRRHRPRARREGDVARRAGGRRDRSTGGMSPRT